MGTQLADDRDEVTVRVALKADDPIQRLRALKSADETVERWLADGVREARREGRSWAAIGDALKVSRQAAWELYNAELRAELDSVRVGSGLSEEQAAEAAAVELDEVRSRRRR